MQKAQHYRKAAFILLTAAITISNSGCSSGIDPKLESRIAGLEAENKALRAKLAEMESTKEAKPAQTKTPESRPDSLSDKTFEDIDDTPTEDMIEDLCKLHVFDSLGSKFSPNEPITRGEYAEWLYNAYNALVPDAKRIRLVKHLPPIFKDCPESNPHFPYVQALANAGFSIGYDDGRFRPDNSLTREELLGIKIGVDVGKTLSPWRSQMDNVWKFSDGKNVDEKFTGYVHQDFYVSGPHGSNIQRAFGKIGTFRPKQPVLRYEAAGTLWQIGQFGDTQNTNAAAVLKARTQEEKS